MLTMSELITVLCLAVACFALGYDIGSKKHE